MRDERAGTLLFISSLIILFLLSIVIGFGAVAFYAKYNVWRSGLAGEAQLKQAEWNRQIIVREAEAKKDAASMLAKAEIERAKGVAEANKIIGDSLKENEAYLRYLWIDSLKGKDGQVVYIPTEAGLPILEAKRLK